MCVTTPRYSHPSLMGCGGFLGAFYPSSHRIGWAGGKPSRCFVPVITKLLLCPKEAQGLGYTARLGQMKADTPLYTDLGRILGYAQNL